MKNDLVKNNGQNEERVNGILQWFHLGEKDNVEKTLEDLKKLNITHLRTGISWADYYTEGAAEWYDWLLPRLAKEVTILPCFLYTPPSIGLAYKASAPPKEAKMYADFMDVFINKYGQYFDWVELWNEPNNRSEYDYTLDPNWKIFSKMIIMASYWSRQLGKKVALGGMSPIDCNWLDYMAKLGALEHIDAVGVHGFPDTFDSYFLPWDEQLAAVRKVLDSHGLNPEIWITEAGYSTWKFDEKKQLREFVKAVDSTADRVYWYSLFDLSQDKATVDGFHLDEREYYFGLKSETGRPKLLFRMLELYGAKGLKKLDWLKEESLPEEAEPEYVLITGGAGFVGVNLADHLLQLGHKVIIFDNLSRPGVEENLRWLLEEHNRDNIWTEIADIRNLFTLKKVVAHSKMVYHLAAQVAVTTSLDDPANDYEINIKGTFNLLEAIRKSPHRPPIIFTSTNKVYGDLNELDFEKNGSRYLPKNSNVKAFGVGENQPLDFHSPYGCSKGSADQYVLDYARSYNLKAAVFRMSCIYGPHQFGTEDQGWVAHFLINTMKSKPIFIYGDGKQVRDILYVEDLVNAFQLAWENIDKVKGNAYNIGGGVDNSISLLELIHWIGEKDGVDINLKFGPVRTGDQVYYVSDFRKFQEAVGWEPAVPKEKGLDQLYDWLLENQQTQNKTTSQTTLANE
jgi:CDP-paratose 2-epimerase